MKMEDSKQSELSSDSSIIDPFETSGDDDSDYNPRTSKKRKLLPDYFGIRQGTNARTGETSINKPQPQHTTKSVLQNATSESTRSNSEDALLKQRIQNSAILDGKYFEVVGKVTDTNHIRAECKLCLQKTTFIKGSVDISTNFVKHLRKKHNNQYEAYNLYKEEKKKNRSNHILNDNNTSASEASASNEKRRLKQTPISFKQKISQKTFDERIIKFVVDSMSPVSIVSNRSFINIFEGMDLKVINRFAAVRKINEQFQNMIKNIKLQLDSCSFVCTTADIWSCKKRSFMGVTCHWIDDQLQRQSAALCCRRFEGTHSFNRIAELLDEIHKSYGLDNKKTMATVTDNGSNFVKCFKEFGISFQEFNLQDDDIEDEEKTETEQCSLEFVSVYESFESENVESMISSEVYRFLPEHLRCASHTINLVATTDYNNSLRSAPYLKNKNCQIFNKCSNLWNKARRPKSAEIIQHVLGHTLSYPSVTRWNSTYDAIQQILRSKEKLPELCNKLFVPVLSEPDISFLQEYVEIMKPLAETLDFLQGEQNTYYGYLLPSIVSMYTKLEKLKLGQSGTINIKQLSKPLDYILESIKRRFKELFMLSSKTAVIAAVTNPRFKMRWFNAFKDSKLQIQAKDVHSWVLAAALTLEKVGEGEAETVLNENVEDTFFDFKEEEFALTPTGPSSDVFQTQFEFELLKYFNDNRVVIGMLNDYSTVKKLFIKYNSILPSSAPVERLFSFAQIINAPKRHAPSDSNFEKLVLLKSNKHF